MSENPKTTWLSMIKDGRDERIAEQEAALDGDAPGSGAYWRFWSDEARAATERALVATTRAEAAEAEVKRLREALRSIDALDPERHVYSCSTDALRGLVLRMGEIARKAYEESSNDQ